DRSTAERHIRWRGLGSPGGLTARPDTSAAEAELVAAHWAGRISIETSDTDRRATVRWTDAEIGTPIVGSAIARAGYGGIVLGTRTAPAFDPKPIARRAADTSSAW